MLNSMHSPSIELPILSVFDLTCAIKTTIEGQFRYVCVQGEVSNCKLQSSGHLYFSLKDPQAQIACVMFKTDAVTLQKIPKDGDEIVIKGALNVYPPSGKYQIVVRTLQWAGAGALLLKLEQLKIALKAKGYFELERKKILPKIPKRIGVVTSPTGAVIQDILNVLKRRFAGFHLILNPVKVQGEGAAQEIAQAIDFFNQHHLVDVMIVGRGGGSIEDLWAFNEEIVAQAIFRSKIPIISAVGHETDFCIADFVADVRAPTPSAAAELVIAEKSQQIKTIQQCSQSLNHCMRQVIRNNKEKLNRFIKDSIIQNPQTIFSQKYQWLDETREELDRVMDNQFKILKQKLLITKKQVVALKPSNQIIYYREKLSFLNKNLDKNMTQMIQHDKKVLQKAVELLHALDPKELLKKGYTLVFSEKDNSIIKSVKTLSAGSSVKLLFADGEARSTIQQIEVK